MSHLVKIWHTQQKAIQNTTPETRQTKAQTATSWETGAKNKSGPSSQRIAGQKSHSTEQSLFLLLVNSLSRAKANKGRRAKPPELEKNAKPRIIGDTARTA